MFTNKYLMFIFYFTDNPSKIEEQEIRNQFSTLEKLKGEGKSNYQYIAQGYIALLEGKYTAAKDALLCCKFCILFFSLHGGYPLSLKMSHIYLLKRDAI